MENFTERKTRQAVPPPGLSMTTQASALWWTSTSHKAVFDDALQIIEVERARARTPRARPGGGVGILTQISDKFFQKAAQAGWTWAQSGIWRWHVLFPAG